MKKIINSFVKQLKSFNIEQYLIGLSWKSPTIHENGSLHYNERIILYIDGQPKQINMFLFYLILFQIVDLKIDFKFKECVGQSFAKKYQKLPDDEDFDIVIKEVYKIFIIIRNQIIHNYNGIKFCDGYIELQDNKGDWHKVISYINLQIINQIAYEYVCSDFISENDRFIFCAMYNDAIENLNTSYVFNLKDACYCKDKKPENAILKLKNTYEVDRWQERHHVKQEIYEEKDNIFIKNPYHPSSAWNKDSKGELIEFKIGTSYLFTYKDKKYLIPREKLEKIDDKYLIPISQISKWEIE